MKFETPNHERAYMLALETPAEGSVDSPTGAFVALDVDSAEVGIIDEFDSPHLLVTEDSDGHVYIKGYEREVRDRLLEKSQGVWSLWDAGISDAEGLLAINGYLEGALFTAVDEDGVSLDGLGHTWSEAAQHEAFVTVTRFIADEDNAEDCKQFASMAGGWTQVGIDLLFTRNREGAGFWDRGAGEVGTRLTEAAHPLGGTHVYLDPELNQLVFESA